VLSPTACSPSRTPELGRRDEGWRLAEDDIRTDALGMVCANEKARALTRALPAGLTLARRTAYFTFLKLFLLVLLVLFVAVVILVGVILPVLLVLQVLPVLVARVLSLSPHSLSLG
jgi:hypothetical protein